jgi:hypothetical protein
MSAEADDALATVEAMICRGLDKKERLEGDWRTVVKEISAGMALMRERFASNAAFGHRCRARFGDRISANQRAAYVFLGQHPEAAETLLNETTSRSVELLGRTLRRRLSYEARKTRPDPEPEPAFDSGSDPPPEPESESSRPRGPWDEWTKGEPQRPTLAMGPKPPQQPQPRVVFEEPRESKATAAETAAALAKAKADIARDNAEAAEARARAERNAAQATPYPVRGSQRSADADYARESAEIEARFAADPEWTAGDEIERLRGEVARLQAELAAAHAEIDRLKAELRQVETVAEIIRNAGHKRKGPTS